MSRLLVLTYKYGTAVEGSEFSGGSLTGPILDLFEAGTLVFVGALVLTLLYPRIAAGCAAIAAPLCLPLYLDFFAPGPVVGFFAANTAFPLQAISCGLVGTSPG